TFTGGSDGNFTIDSKALQQLIVNCSGDNQISLEDLPTGIATTVNGAGGNDTLEVDDTSDTQTRNYIVDAGSVQRDPTSTITFSGISTVYLTGSSGTDDYEIHNTLAGSTTNLFLNAAANSPTNTVNVQATSGKLNIYSATANFVGNQDIINIGAGD